MLKNFLTMTFMYVSSSLHIWKTLSFQQTDPYVLSGERMIFALPMLWRCNSLEVHHALDLRVCFRWVKRVLRYIVLAPKVFHPQGRWQLQVVTVLRKKVVYMFRFGLFVGYYCISGPCSYCRLCSCWACLRTFCVCCAVGASCSMPPWNPWPFQGLV